MPVQKHLTPVYSPAEPDQDVLQLQTLLEEYLKAFDLHETGRLSQITDRMKPLMKKLEFIPKGEVIEDFHTNAQQIARRIELSRRSLSREGMHIFGVSPDTMETARMIASIWWNKRTLLPDPEKIVGACFEDAANLVSFILADNFDGQPEAATISPKDRDYLKAWCLETAANIKKSNLEIKQLLHAMDGGYIEPGLGGSLTLGKMETLPTGRNFFAQDVTGLPTKEAWDIGKILAVKLINRFLQEKKRFPERVGISLWSTDAFKSDGEVFSQILCLLGVEPIRDQRGRINGIKAIALPELIIKTSDGKKIPRPRVNITVQTSSILRDMVPHFCQWIDEAVIMVSLLDEPEEKNFILKHTRNQMAELQKELDETLTESALFRMASFRVFSSAPGTYVLATETNPGYYTVYIDKKGRERQTIKPKRAVIDKAKEIKKCLYSKQYAKTCVVCQTASENFPARIGLPLELVPSGDISALKPGEELKLKVYYNGTGHLGCYL